MTFWPSMSPVKKIGSNLLNLIQFFGTFFSSFIEKIGSKDYFEKSQNSTQPSLHTLPKEVEQKGFQSISKISSFISTLFNYSIHFSFLEYQILQFQSSPAVKKTSELKGLHFILYIEPSWP